MNHTRRFQPALVLTIVAALFAAGCGLSNRDDISTMIVDENGALVCALVEPNEGDYTEAELERFIQKQIAQVPGAAATESAEESEQPRITLNNLDLRDNAVHIEMSYQSWQDYAAFNEMTCFVGTIAEAEEAGYSFDVELLDEEGAAADAETIAERAKEWKVLIIEEPMNVRVPDKILYATSNMKITGRLTAVYNRPSDSGAGEADSAASDSAAEASSADGPSENEDSVSDATSGEQESETNLTADAALERFAVDDFDLSCIIFK